MNEVIDEIVRGVAFLADTKKISITSDISWKLPVIYADRNRIQQVLLNIVNNAIKYTPEGGKIHIEARDEADHLLISISDTGIGIPQKDLENIFSGFYHAGYKLSYEYKGPGLGLAISRRIIESHGGRIWAESETGKGSTIHFTLPKQVP
jgi:signal transduction histidine kinase